MLGPLQAYMARFKTDRMIALVRSMALKQLDGAGALAELEAYKVPHTMLLLLLLLVSVNASSESRNSQGCLPALRCASGVVWRVSAV